MNSSSCIYFKEAVKRNTTKNHIKHGFHQIRPWQDFITSSWPNFLWYKNIFSIRSLSEIILKGKWNKNISIYSFQCHYSNFGLRGHLYLLKNFNPVWLTTRSYHFLKYSSFYFLLSCFKVLKKRGILKKLAENSPVLQISMSTGNLSILFYVFSISLCIYAHKFCFMLLSCLKMVGIYLFSVQKFTLALIITIFCIEKRPRVKSESILSLINVIFWNKKF